MRYLSEKIIEKIEVIEDDKYYYDYSIPMDESFLITKDDVKSHNSAKTYSILQYLIALASMPPDQRAEALGIEEPLNYLKVNIVRKVSPSLRATVYQDFLEIMRRHELYNEENHNKTFLQYEHNGVLFSFVATADQPEKLRGLKSDITFINEANELTKEEYRQLNFRTKYKMIFDYNPSMDQHWLYDLEDDPNIATDAFYSTYKHNAFLGEEQKKVIEDLKFTDPEQYATYALGRRAKKNKGKIYRGWEKIDKLPDGAVFWGLDFGYTKDPTALVKCVKIENNLYVKECFYKTKAHTADIKNALEMHSYMNEVVYCDHNQPQIMEELRRYGVRAVKARKGNNSVLEGIQALKRIKIFITSDSENGWKEYNNYSWKLRKGGDPDNDADWENYPEDKSNHFCDALRYAYYSHFAIGKSDFWVV